MLLSIIYAVSVGSWMCSSPGSTATQWFDILFDILWGGQPWTTMDKREPLAVQIRIRRRIGVVPAEGFEPPTV